MQNFIIRKTLCKRKSNIFLSIVLFTITITAYSQAVHAIPSYGFGANENGNHIHINMSMNNINNRDAIHIDINVMGTAQQDIPRNSERIGTLTTPSGRQIGVFGGESMRSMEKGAGHFSDTGLNYGNTALIGHNRGSISGFFSFVKDLETGQIIALEANGMTKNYAVVETHRIHASETDLLTHFGDSRLTLITCWEDAKDYRRVVVAYEV